ncbi:MAG: hypothetical protein ACPL4N_03060 [Candidatus Norongarragalinales archaeon]
MMEKLLALAEVLPETELDEILTNKKQAEYNAQYEKEQAELEEQLHKELAKVGPKAIGVQAQIITRYRNELGYQSGKLRAEFEAEKKNRQPYVSDQELVRRASQPILRERYLKEVANCSPRTLPSVVSRYHAHGLDDTSIPAEIQKMIDARK